jgi:hypothetical protein
MDVQQYINDNITIRYYDKVNNKLYTNNYTNYIVDSLFDMEMNTLTPLLLQCIENNKYHYVKNDAEMIITCILTEYKNVKIILHFCNDIDEYKEYTLNLNLKLGKYKHDKSILFTIFVFYSVTCALLISHYRKN